MITATSGKEEILAAIEDSIQEMLQLVSSLDAEQLNRVPYAGSWTAGQLFSHVTKSIHGMGNLMPKPSEPAQRDPGEKIAGLKNTFLNFSTKMQSPDFILPDPGPYEKEPTIQALTGAFDKMKAGTIPANLDELLTGLPFGEVTKLELLHFVLYHTQRHTEQMRRIVGSLRGTGSMEGV